MTKKLPNSRNRDIPEYGKRQADDDKKAFAVRFAFSVNNLGVNDTEVSRASGISRSAVGRFRNAESLPDGRDTFRLADALSVNPRWLLTGEGSPDTDIEAGFADPDAEQELLWHYRCIPDAHRPVVIDVAKALAEANALDLGNSRKSAQKTFHTPTVPYGPEPKR